MRVSDVRDRKTDMKNMYDTVQPNILCLQEVTSLRIVKEIRKQMEWDAAHVIISDFTQKDRASRSSFEVAVISDYPFEQVIEFDPSPDNYSWDIDELPLEPNLKLGIADVNTSRGYLWVKMDDPNITLAILHLKSSLGKKGTSDSSNAQKRELVMATVASGVVEDKAYFPDHSYLVLGDFNVGHSDTRKNGTDLENDCFSATCSTDRYDETHALLHAGLVSDLQMKNLTITITETTYPDYPGSPIDNIYVDGKHKSRFSNASKETDTFGSDHLPVWTIYKTP